MPSTALAPLSESVVNDSVVRIIKDKMSQGRKLHLRVDSKSMLPTLQVGERVSVVALSAKESVILPAGSVVVFRAGDRFTIHRLTHPARQTDEMLHTKGDNSPSPDMAVPRSALIGKLEAVERGGEWVSPHYSISAQLVHVRRKLFDAAVFSVITASRLWPLRAVFTAGYAASVPILPRSLKGIAPGHSLYLKGSAAISEIEPAISDLDTLLVLPPCSAEQFCDYSLALQRRCDSLSRVMPHIGGMFIYSNTMFSFWSAWGGIRALGSREWRLLVGKDMRRAQTSPERLAVKLSALRELHQSYAYAFRNLRHTVVSETPTIRIRMLRHLLDMLKYANFLSADPSNDTFCSASRRAFITGLPDGDSKRIAQHLHELIVRRPLPLADECRAIFLETARVSFSTICADCDVQRIGAAMCEPPGGSLLEMFRSGISYSRLPQEHWQEALQNFFKRPDWGWHAPPLPFMLGNVLTLLQPLHSTFIATEHAAESDSLMNSELAEMIAIFSFSFRSGFAKEFFLCGAYFAALKALLQGGEQRLTLQQLESRQRGSKSEKAVQSALSFLQKPSRSPTPAQFKQFGVHFSELLDDCIRIRSEKQHE